MSTQHWNPAQYATNARFVADLGMSLVELLAPRDGEAILDLGCGDGVLSLKLQQAGCEVLALDASAEMVQASSALGLAAQQHDAQALPFEARFDAVFSNAALHWMRQPQAVIDGVWRALRPGGRFVAECGGAGNVAQIVQALEAALARRGMQVAGPWYFPALEEYRALLQAQGFQVGVMELITRPTPLPGDIRAWLETFAQTYSNALAPAARAAFLDEVVEQLRPALCDADGKWTADYVRLRFAAFKPAASTRSADCTPGPGQALHMRRLHAENPADVAALQAMLEAAPQYALLVEGCLPAPDAALQELQSLPPGKQLSDKFCCLLLDQQGNPLGVSDLIRGYPEADMAFIGLLVFSEQYQGQGHGAQALAQLQQQARAWGCHTLRVGVVARNLRGLQFWRREGFTEIYRRTLAQFTAEVIVMQKTL